ncbi:MAG: tetratricopeptide repeat protein [Acidobacteria bacterium]|nr:tetratricopeptide repeat protein [Acidobacteriota bacterium]
MASRDKIIAKAEKLVSKGKIEEAIGQYEMILKDSPSDVNTLNRVGDLWVRANKTQEAVNVFSRIAEHYSRDGFFLKAIAIFKKINKLDPSRLDVYEKLAELYSRQGLAMEAKSQYIVLADAATKQGNTKSALETYRKIAELDPNSINVHVKLADLHHASGEKDKALEQYEKVGRMLLRKGMVDESVQVFKKALKIDPDNVDLIGSLAGAMTEAGQAAQALVLLESARAENPSNGKLTSLYGRTLLESGQRGKAKTVLEEAVAVLPQDHDSRIALSELYLAEASADLAQEILEPVVNARADAGDVSGAIGLLNGVLETDASHIPTLRQVVEVYRRANQETKIITSLNALAEAHRAMGENEAAASALEQILEREPENEQIRKKLAMLRGSTGTAPAVEPEPELELEPEPEAEVAIEPEIEIGASAELDLEEVTDSSTGIEDDDDEAMTNFIVEHMTEAEVFSKYGLIDRAIEHLQKVISQVPDHLPAYQQLFRAYLDEGQNDNASNIASPLIGLLRSRGDEDELRKVEDELAARGMTVSPADSGRVSAPSVELDEIDDLTIDDSGDAVLAVDVDDSVSIDIEESPIEEISFDTGEEPEELELDVAEDAIEIEAADEAMEIEMEAPIEIDLEEEVVELETEEPHLEFETEEPVSEIEIEEEEAVELDLGDEATVEEKPPVAAGPMDHAVLSEVDFYIDEQLYDEARERLQELQAKHPGSDEIASRMERVAREEAERTTAAEEEAAAPPSLDIESELSSLLPDEEPVEAGMAVEPPASEAPSVTISEEDEESLFADEDDFFDLAAELEEELGGDLDGDVTVEDEEQSLEDVFREFKKGVEEQLDSEDYDTHYNLGIAYKEMGLTDEAIGEFQIASKDPQRAVECCSMLGLCFLEKGMPQLAIKWYTKGIELPETTEDEHLGLMYELGNAYQQIGDTAQAHKAFVEIYGVNSNYRDVAERIRELQNA